MVFGLFGRNRRRQAKAQYDRLVAASRQVGYYRDLGVPDSVTGRLELLMLHVCLWARRAAGQGREGGRVAEALTGAFFDDMQVHLRESGIGDKALSRKLGEVAESFYGRLSAYAAALEAGGTEALQAVLQRNILDEGYDGRELALQVQRLAAALESADLRRMLSGEIETRLPAGVGAAHRALET